ncbi:MAG: hypothetical protein IPM48_00505 [Saprospiraceae bacterium]|nr:hypothetical protein [Saprospiraceae bacterium]
MVKNLSFLCLLGIVLFFLPSCQGPDRLIKGPQEMTDWVMNSIKLNDTVLLDKIIPTKKEFLETLVATKVPDSTIRVQQEMFSHDSVFENERLEIYRQFRSVKDTVQYYGVDFSSLTIQDTIPYRYYANSMVPYVKMDLKTKLMSPDSVYFILAIHSCFLMVDGWNLGRLAFYKADSLDLLHFHQVKYVKY